MIKAEIQCRTNAANGEHMKHTKYVPCNSDKCVSFIIECASDL